MLPGWPLVLLLQPAPPQDPTPLQKMQASVLLVRGKLDGSHGQQGSGVVIAPQLVATNAHVVAGAHGLTTLTFTSSPRLNFSVPSTLVQALTLQADGEDSLRYGLAQPGERPGRCAAVWGRCRGLLEPGPGSKACGGG